jgi:hypothetical protein
MNVWFSSTGYVPVLGTESTFNECTVAIGKREGENMIYLEIYCIGTCFQPLINYVGSILHGTVPVLGTESTFNECTVAIGKGEGENMIYLEIYCKGTCFQPLINYVGSILHVGVFQKK